MQTLCRRVSIWPKYRFQTGLILYLYTFQIYSQFFFPPFLLISETILSNYLPLRHKIANASRYAIRSLKILLYVSLQLNYTTACQYHLTLSLSRRGNEQSTELLEDTHFIISYFRVSVLARSTPVARHNTNRTGNNLSYLYGGDAGFVARYERISERTFPSRERQPDDNRGSRGIAAPQPRWWNPRGQ